MGVLISDLYLLAGQSALMNFTEAKYFLMKNDPSLHFLVWNEPLYHSFGNKPYNIENVMGNSNVRIRGEPRIITEQDAGWGQKPLTNTAMV